MEKYNNYKVFNIPRSSGTDVIYGMGHDDEASGCTTFIDSQGVEYHPLESLILDLLRVPFNGFDCKMIIALTRMAERRLNISLVVVGRAAEILESDTISTSKATCDYITYEYNPAMWSMRRFPNKDNYSWFIKFANQPFRMPDGRLIRYQMNSGVIFESAIKSDDPAYIETIHSQI